MVKKYWGFREIRWTITFWSLSLTFRNYYYEKLIFLAPLTCLFFFHIFIQFRSVLDCIPSHLCETYAKWALLARTTLTSCLAPARSLESARLRTHVPRPSPGRAPPSRSREGKETTVGQFLKSIGEWKWERSRVRNKLSGLLGIARSPVVRAPETQFPRIGARRKKCAAMSVVSGTSVERGWFKFKKKERRWEPALEQQSHL